MLANANKWVLLCIAGLMVLERYIHAWGLKKQCRVSTSHYTQGQAFINSYTAALFNNITPGASGGQFVQVYMFRKQGVPVAKAIGVLWLDFIIYQSVMALFVLFLLVCKFMYFYTNYSQFFLIVLIGFLVNSAVILFLWALVKFPWFYRWLTTSGIRIAAKLHIVKDGQKAKEMIDDQLNRFDSEIVVLKHHKKMIMEVAFTVALRLLIYYSVPALAVVALHLPMNFNLWINTVALSSFVAMINAFVPLPGSSGGTEATFVLMFSTLFKGIDSSSIMLIWRLFTYYFQTFVGALVFLYGRSRPEYIPDTMHAIPIDGKMESETAKEKEDQA